MQNDNLTRQIIGCAYRVHNTLGFGFLESVYEKSMPIELAKVGLNVSSQHPVNVHYDNQIVGQFTADLLVEDEIIVELKSVQKLVQAFEVQLVNYLAATNKPVGLLLNFGPNCVEVKRKVKDLQQIRDGSEPSAS